MRGQILLDAQFFAAREAIAFPQAWLTIGAVQHEHGLSLCPNDMDMGGAVIGGVDHHPQAIEAKNSRHSAP